MKKIQAVKLAKWDGKLDSLTGVTVSFFEKIHGNDGEFSHIESADIAFKNYFVHDDMLEVFTELSKHMDCILEMQPDEFINSDELSTVCTAIVFKGEDEQEGIILMGTKKLSNGLTLNLQTPIFVFADNNDYKNIELLYSCVAKISQEANEILSRKKQRIIQMEMEFAG